MTPYFPISLYDYQAIALPQGGLTCRTIGTRTELMSIADAIHGINKLRLAVDIKATNSGVPINNRVYPGPAMMDSVASWTADYPKPITDDHPHSSMMGGRTSPKVLGRVTKAEYTRLVDEVSWSKDWQTPFPAGSDGSGFIRLKGFVSDREAIEKILDGRLLTVSTGAHPQAFFCSICSQDWIQKGPCDHRPGQTYTIDSKKAKGRYKAYGITGKLAYNHVAFVDMPADVQARVLQSEIADSQGYYQNATDSLPVCAINRLTLIDEDTGHMVEINLTSDNFASTSLVAPPSEDVKIEAVADLQIEITPKENTMSTESQDTPATEVPVTEEALETPEQGELSTGDTPPTETTETAEDATCTNCSDSLEEPTTEPTVDDAPTTEPTKTETTVIETMASELERRKAQVNRLENALSDSVAELTEVRKELDTLQMDGRKQLVDRVMDLRLSLDKPDVREAQTEVDLGAIRAELEKRTVDSLRDSAQDLQLELAERRSGTTISPGMAPVANPQPMSVSSGGNSTPDKSKTLDRLRSDQ